MMPRNTMLYGDCRDVLPDLRSLALCVVQPSPVPGVSFGRCVVKIGYPGSEPQFGEAGISKIDDGAAVGPAP